MKCSDPSYFFASLLPSRTAAVTAGLALCLCGALAACGSSAPLFLSDGRPTTQVQCTGTFASCEQQASVHCNGAFQTVNRSSDSGMLTLLYACQKK
ncbi:hypothetical protein [Paraburkholderia hayleyella]|uniref:hypothetical protein n=1 Tax=Paraburkholderia hayleyella TaxID=2152889 RepID=UPI001FE57690|nr:hypothetical protein [Paraburkholderia hayleyella]